ncbi:MAG TPA: hypothetical protein VNR70_16515 [Steroidobacteraceae bacterium]|jgi:hypothetical protein|nr:hypothetical protein [Steroidobacteraceae bacterium]
MSRRVGAVLAAGCLLLGACHKAPSAGADAAPASEAKPAAAAKPQAAAKEDADTKDSAGEGVTLTPDQVEKLGVVAEPAQSIEYSDEAAGYGVVVSHDTIAQAAAELVTAQATERLSSSSLARAKKLAGTPGAVSADVEETAAQKAAVDAAALTLTTQRLSSTLGMKPPWKNGGKDATLQELASGRIKLVRVTFPLGTLSGAAPASLRATHIGAIKPGTGWKMTVIWDAPADASVPGRSFFALLKGSDAGEGERLQVWVPIGASVSGVMIPASATVMSEGKFWCYVEKKPGMFTRIEIDTSKPTADGYFVSEGVEVGDKVVITAAGHLLAKESNSGAEPD